MGGDFNFRPGSLEHIYFRRFLNYRDCETINDASMLRMTWAAENMYNDKSEKPGKLDYFFYKGMQAGSMGNFSVPAYSVEKTDLSDHYPVIMDIEI